MIRLAVRVPAEEAERVLAALVEMAPGGVEQVDGDGFVEYAVYGVPGELPSLHEGEAEVGGVRVTVSGREVPGDWAERWRRFHRPVLVGGRIYVRPPWEPAAARPAVEEIVIDPGAAFGTGSHATTRLCLELLLEVEPRGSLADLGCGSGVLAIAAAKLGFGPVVALDADRDAVSATLANAEANGVALAAVERADLRSGDPPPAEVVVANLMRPLLLRLAPALRPGRALVLSGLLEHEWDEVAAAFPALTVRDRRSAEGWTALLLEPRAGSGAEGGGPAA